MNESTVDRGAVRLSFFYTYLTFAPLILLFPEKSRKRHTRFVDRDEENLDLSSNAVARGDIYNRGGLLADNRVKILINDVSPRASLFVAPEISSPHRDRDTVTGRPKHSRKCTIKFLSISPSLSHTVYSFLQGTHFRKKHSYSQCTRLVSLPLPSIIDHSSSLFFFFTITFFLEHPKNHE